MPRVYVHKSLEQRLLEHRIIDADGCWISTYKSKEKGGHPIIGTSKGVSEYVSRVAYNIWVGPLSENPRIHVLHQCDKPDCFKPECLYEGTTKQNIADAKARGRWPKGETHANATRTNVEAEKVRQAYATGRITQRELADMFHMPISTVNDIIHHRRYA